MMTDAEMHAEALEALLEREAEALRNAAFAALEGIAAEKTRLAQALQVALPVQGGDERLAEALQRLRFAATRNAALLSAMREGLRAATDRLAALSTPAATLQTYDGAGQRRRIAVDPPTAEHRA